MDRKSARPGHKRAGDKPDHPREPAQRHHQESDQLGRHHCRAYRDHRFLWPERPLPRLRPEVRSLRLDPGHHRAIGIPLLALQTERLALTLARAVQTGVSGIGELFNVALYSGSAAPIQLVADISGWFLDANESPDWLLTCGPHSTAPRSPCHG